MRKTEEWWAARDARLRELEQRSRESFLEKILSGLRDEQEGRVLSHEVALARILE